MWAGVVVPWMRMVRCFNMSESVWSATFGLRGWAMMSRVPAVAPLMRALTHAAERVIAEERAILRDGSAIVIRPLATGDVTAITTWFEGLGPATRYARFLGIIDRLDERRLSLLTQ